ncbi:hypothetical protein [Desulfobacula sp.]|uniref:hypothetical protein n=1 Tax=Desulfobacula sp. TaxID=2593537 RepID=UPI00262D0018|nr:hypothetical protein [Desulfobacula sp.]
MNKLSKILSGEQFPSNEIQAEIATISKDHTAAMENLISLDADLEAKRLENLGKAMTKELKKLEAESAELKANIETMGIAIEKLEKAHTEAVNREIPAELNRIREKINDLHGQKAALMPEVLKACGQAAALFFQVRGRINFEMGPMLGPNNIMSREDQALYFDTWRDALEDKIIFSNEIDRLTTRRQELLIEGMRRGLSVR